MSLEREEKHLPILIASCFALNFIFGGVGQAMPEQSFGQVFSWQWSSLVFMAGCCLYAAKLHTEKWHISSAGFILISIGQGIFYTLQNTQTSEHDIPTFAAGMMVFIPGILFICYYSGFPAWLRILGVLSTFPFALVVAKIDSHQFELVRDRWLVIAGFFMTQLTSVMWGYFALRPYGKTKVQH